MSAASAASRARSSASSTSNIGATSATERPRPSARAMISDSTVRVLIGTPPSTGHEPAHADKVVAAIIDGSKHKIVLLQQRERLPTASTCSCGESDATGSSSLAPIGRLREQGLLTAAQSPGPCTSTGPTAPLSCLRERRDSMAAPQRADQRRQALPGILRRHVPADRERRLCKPGRQILEERRIQRVRRIMANRLAEPSLGESGARGAERRCTGSPSLQDDGLATAARQASSGRSGTWSRGCTSRPRTLPLTVPATFETPIRRR